ncbi:DUF3192 domain-containing protein [Thalassomonas sp. M1454]|uniref:DUF3192 domain-containing protein n=1 Tax=Thalassomonas sp. M1454 TaxID=2594477 RepID=UPI00117FCD7B|nr:DUF3192 domain-containing protein [Thalassomonas sp. M1454]TRX57072.1 DUF3192 domain-containing protein [Thalassomonas sp. M1454]
MNKKVTFRILIAVVLYGIFAAGIWQYYKDTPQDVKNMDWDEREGYNRQYIAKLKLDKVNIDLVFKDLGNPDITEAKKSADANYQVLFYRTQHRSSDGITTQDECTALLFENDILIGIGESAYNDYKSK